MKEKVLSNKKKGMFVLLLTILVYLAAIAGCIVGGFMVDAGKPPVLLIICIVWLTIGWVPLCGPEGAETAGGPGPHTVW